MASSSIMMRDVGPRAKCDSVIYEAVAKACEIVVSSRCPPGATRTTPSSSSRFNLQMPEYPDVRKTLAPLKRSLHVPLRLDVCYQTTSENHQKQLLERWCIEYAPCHAAFFQEECSSLDPLVQLRHVCKKLVLWLRTLYCTSHLLPCKRSNKLHFSIYVSDSSNQDALELQRNMQFAQHVHSSVYTPYGRLELQVLHAPRQAVAHLFPKQPTARWTTAVQNSNVNRKSASRPIPTTRQPWNNNSSSPNRYQMRLQQQQQVAPQSAPAHISIIPNYTASPSQSNGIMQAPTPPSSRPQAGLRATSYKSPIVEQRHARPVVTRTQSALSDREIQYQQPLREEPQQQQDEENNKGTTKQKRVLSGLSLALMNAEEEQQQQQATPLPSSTEFQHSSPPSPRVVEQRRAALHHAPPLLTEHSSDYGYAYNNHIPQLSKSPTTSELQQQQQQASPALGSTPPQPMFCVGSTRPAAPSPLLIPPLSSKKQNNEAGVAPPFAALPTTLGETPKVAQQPMVLSNPPPPLAVPPHQGPPISSLDLLHSSPFQQQNSILSSLSGTEHFASQSESLMRSGMQAADDFYYPHYQLEQDDMPFAIAEQQAPPQQQQPEDLGASAALAHKCATAGRLKLFDSTTIVVQEEEEEKSNNNDNAAMNSLALQLEGFRSFGASLTPAAGDAETATSSTSTPISLKT